MAWPDYRHANRHHALHSQVCICVLYWLSLLRASVGDTRTFQPGDGAPEYLSTASPYNAFCPARCPDEVAWPETDTDLANYLQELHAKSPSTPITIRGRGHSYTCQSTSSAGVIIDMRQFDKLEIERLSDGMLEVTFGAGLNSGQVQDVLSKHGWSIPHGICSTVGLAGYLLNNGNHPTLFNYLNYYGARDFVREIHGVTLLGSRISIRGTSVEIISRSPFESLTSLKHKIAMLSLWKGGAQALFRKFGANMFIATEFKVEVREKPEPIAIEVVYELHRLKLIKASLHKSMLPSNPDISCFLMLYPHMANRSLGSPEAHPTLNAMADYFSLVCLSWNDGESKSSLCQKVQAFQDEPSVLCQEYFHALPRMTQNEGFGWYPFFVQVFVPNLVNIGTIIDFVLDLEKNMSDCRISEGNSITATPPWAQKDFRNQQGFWSGGHLSDEEYLKGAWLNLDLWLGDDLTRKHECIGSVRRIQEELTTLIDSLNLFRRSRDTHLPDCSVGEGQLKEVQWKHQLYDSDYDRLSAIKSLWDPQRQISFFWGVDGQARNPATCKVQFADFEDQNCVAASISASKMVATKRSEIDLMCPATPDCNDSCQWGCRLPVCCKLKDAEYGKSTGLLYLLSQLDPPDYNDFVAWVIVAVMLLTGFGFELLVIKYMAQQDVDQINVKVMWRFAKACFPVLGLVSILACLHGASWSIFLFTVTLFKMGFPETTVYFSLGMSSPTCWLCILNGITGVAMTMHHVASIIAFAFILRGITPIDQQAVTISILAVMIHCGTVTSELAAGFGRKAGGKCSKLIKFIGLSGSLSSEFVLQAEIFAYYPFVKFPINVALVLMSASHLLCLAVIIAYLAQYRQLRHFYVPVSSDEEEEDEVLKVRTMKRVQTHDIIVDEAQRLDLRRESPSDMFASDLLPKMSATDLLNSLAQLVKRLPAERGESYTPGVDSCAQPDTKDEDIDAHMCPVSPSNGIVLGKTDASI